MIENLDIVTRKKLILVKQIYQRALIQSQFTHQDIDRMLAVIGFDFAIETMLKTTISALNPTAKLQYQFPDIVRQAKTEFELRKKKLPGVAQIHQVHDLRNVVSTLYNHQK